MIQKSHSGILRLSEENRNTNSKRYIHILFIATLSTTAKNVLCGAQSLSHVQLFATLRAVAYQSPLSMDSPGKNTGVGCHALLQGIFLIQGSTCISYVFCIGRWVLYPQGHLGSPSWEISLYKTGSCDLREASRAIL